MFSFFDYFFKEKKHKQFGYKTESELILQDVRQKDFEQIDKLKDGEKLFTETEVNQAIVYTRQDVVLLVAFLQRTNMLIRWIRFLLLIIIILLLIVVFK